MKLTKECTCAHYSNTFSQCWSFGEKEQNKRKAFDRDKGYVEIEYAFNMIWFNKCQHCITKLLRWKYRGNAVMPLAKLEPMGILGLISQYVKV